MEILASEMRFDTGLTIKKEWIPTVTFDTPYQLNIVWQFAEMPDANDKMLELLKLFNSNIIKVDMQLQGYEVLYGGKVRRLPIARLSRGEKLLALCLMAHETQNTVYVSNELTQLSKPHILALIDMFRNSPYIKLVPPTNYCKHILDSLL